jgi:hypothetical protein
MPAGGDAGGIDVAESEPTTTTTPATNASNKNRIAFSIYRLKK